jgi:UDP-N-acetylglucosamine 2-epimerase (non-hydrolysing)
VILAVYGTTGELIKLAPVLRRLRDRGHAPLTATTAQQVTQIREFLDDLEVPQPDWWLARGRDGRDLEHRGDIPPWLATVAASFARRRREIRRRLVADGRPGMVLVHGDTLTTVLGGVAGRALGLPVGHVEAGLRSGSWREPFPEELDRRIVSRLATIHFAPGAWAADNLRAAGVAGTIVDTGANTVGDAIRDLPMVVPELVLPDGPFGVVSLHREELLRDEPRCTATLEALARAARDLPLLFVDHSVTAAAIRRQGLDGLFDSAGLRRIPRMPHRAFMWLLARAAFLVTDSGGSQEECAALGIPCLIHRRRTERLDGLSEGIVVLSGLEVDPIERFISKHRAGGHAAAGGPRKAPSDVIVDWLQDAGYAQPASGR